MVGLGIPVAVVAVWRHLLARHPMVALALAIVWAVICVVVVMVRQALSKPVGRRLEQAGNAADRAVGLWLSSYGRRYRRWVLNSRRYIDIKDLTIVGDHTPELDDVYVDVALIRRAPHLVSGNPLSGVPVDATGRYSVSDFLDRREQVVLAVSGPPGSGKSTLLAHAARRSARSGRRDRRIPVLLALREHAGTITASPETVLPEILRLAIRGVPGRHEPDGWWEGQLGQGKCMILLDGLDELAREEQRRAVTIWVERQISSYPDNHFVITSRPHGFPGLMIPQASVLAVRPFTAEQVQLFLNRWYQAAERHASSVASKDQPQAVRLDATESAAKLLKLLHANPALNDLTANPLLLTMIATVHLCLGELPGSRADLYEEICQVMLSRRIQAKDLPELLPWPTKQKLLTTLAFQMMLKKFPELPESEVLKILGPLLRYLPQPVTGQAFLEDISSNGLFVEVTVGRYAFVHLTFQEYLAARHITANPSLAETLTAVVDDPWWHETLLLYAATADADWIVRACLKSATIPALTLAFGCADACAETSKLDPKLRQRLDRVRDQAYEQHCDPQHRKLIAAVLAARLARQTIITTAGTQLCDRPVPANLYWLFLQDRNSPQLDSPCEPIPDRPALGIWRSQAVAFVTWLNAIGEGFAQAEFRLPHQDEFHGPAVTEALPQLCPDSVTGAWAQFQHDGAAPGLWVPPGQPDPHLVTGDTIRQAIFLDTKSTEALIKVITGTTFSVAFNLARALVRVVALALEIVPAGTLDRALERAWECARALDGACNLDRIHVRFHARVHALSLNLDPAHDRIHDRDLAHNLAHDLAFVLTLTRDLARDLDRDLEREFTRDLTHAHTLAGSPTGDRAHALDRDLDRDPRVRLLGVSDVPLSWISDGPLGRISWDAIPAGTLSREARRAFADELSVSAGIGLTTRIRASLDGSLAETLRDMRPSGSLGGDVSPGWSLATGAGRLADACARLLDKRRFDGPDTAGIRTIALALASDSIERGDQDAAGILRVAAATITLLQQRQQGRAPIGESVILALA
jgi:hypothetical protein